MCIWSRKISKLSVKYYVLYFLFEIVVWIQAKNKASCPNYEETWRKQNIVLVVDPRACAQQRFSFYSTVISYKQRPRRLSLCCANWSSTGRSSVIVFLEFNQSGVFITKSWLRTRKMLKIETTAKNFKIFCSLQVRKCVYTYRTLCACQ